MGSESVEVEEKKATEGHEAPPEADSEAAAVEEEDEEGEEEGDEEQVTPEDKKGVKKRNSPEEHEEEPEEGSGTNGKRPARERRTVERYSALSLRKASASKTLSIPQGSGTKLKDIPNVAFKLSKRKVDDNLQALHSILFGRKSNAHFLKRNILQFSGFVWTENKERHEAKAKEKLDKFTKDKLIGFCEVLDIHFPKTSTRKEDVRTKLLKFLESPHVTRDLLLADQEKKGKKRRSRTKVSSDAADDVSDKETKKFKKSVETEGRKRRKQSPKTEDNEPEGSAGSGGTKDASSGEEDNNDLEEESDHVKVEETKEHVSQEPLESKNGSEERHTEAAEPEAKGGTPPIMKTSSVKSDKSRLKPVSKKDAQPVEDESDTAPDIKHSSTKEQKNSKVGTKEKAALVRKEDTQKYSRKNVSLDVSNSGASKSSKSKKEDRKKGQNKEKVVHKEKKAMKKEAKPAPTASAKEQGKGKKKAGPTTEELHSVAINILKEVDFNTATLADVLKQLGAHFDMDLMDRRAEVKSIIEEVINNMTDDDNDDDGDDDNLGGNDEGNTKEEESDGDGKK